MRKILKFCCVFIFTSQLFANPLEFKTLSANFTQNVTSQGSKIVYGGNFIANESRAFWHYETPTLKNIYFSGEEVVQIEPELEQIIITSIEKTPNLTEVLSKAKKITPEVFEAKFDDITYKITLKNSVLSRIDYTDKLDNEVSILLTNVQKNISLDENQLTPVLPKGYDLITQ